MSDAATTRADNLEDYLHEVLEEKYTPSEPQPSGLFSKTGLQQIEKLTGKNMGGGKPKDGCSFVIKQGKNKGMTCGDYHHRVAAPGCGPYCKKHASKSAEPQPAEQPTDKQPTDKQPTNKHPTEQPKEQHEERAPDGGELIRVTTDAPADAAQTNEEDGPKETNDADDGLIKMPVSLTPEEIKAREEKAKQDAINEARAKDDCEDIYLHPKWGEKLRAELPPSERDGATWVEWRARLHHRIRRIDSRERTKQVFSWACGATEHVIGPLCKMKLEGYQRLMVNNPEVEAPLFMYQKEKMAWIDDMSPGWMLILAMGNAALQLHAINKKKEEILASRPPSATAQIAPPMLAPESGLPPLGQPQPIKVPVLPAK